MNNYLKSLFAVSGLLLAFASTSVSAQSVIGQQEGSIDWNGWELDYDMYLYADGLTLENVKYNGKEILGRASFPVMSVYYDGPCGPYADRLNGVQQPVSWANNELLVAREFTQNGEQWFELGIREFIGSYDIYQVWYFSENGALDGHTFSRGVQCNYFHVHYPMWRLDFDIDGSANDRIVRYNSADSFQTMNTEFQQPATNAFQHGWYVEDSVTGSRVRVDFDSGAWNVGGTVIPETDYANNLVGGIAYDRNELGWSGGASRDFPYINGESINNTDLTMWYRGYLPHTTTEGSALWHSTGVRITVVDDEADFDSDGIPDSQDPDDDNDGVLDVDDDLPFNPNESVDTDSDGIGNNADTDDDNDGVDDSSDAFPLDPTESSDSDGDGIGDNADNDADNDGISDEAEYDYNSISSDFGNYNIPPNSGTSTRTINLSSRGLEIGQTLTISNIRAKGDLNYFSETFTLIFNDGEYNTGELQSGRQCASSLEAVTQNIDAEITVIDIGSNTPGIRVQGQTSGAVDTLGSNCVGVDYRFTITGEDRLLDTDADQIANIYDLDSDNDAIADIVEAGLSDADGDFRVDSLSQQGSVTNPPDADNDGKPDFVDLESGNPANNGTAFDITGSGYAPLDTNNDGTVNSSDATGGQDANNNGIDDAIEFGTTDGGTTGGNDTDGDGVADIVDLYPNNPARGAGIWREMFEGISGIKVSDLLGASNFPDNPDLVEELTSFKGPRNIADSYGNRIHGIFYAPVSGSYTFWISGDDYVRLNLSTDSNPLNKNMIADMRGWTGVLQWNKYPEQKSQPVNLVQGQPYYLEVLHKEGRYGDHVAVGWQRPGNNTITVLDDSLFEVDVNVVDTDGDGVPDNIDAFPNDPTETTDTDGDGVGDNGDAFPNDASETTDTDGDGYGDNSDPFPNDPTRPGSGSGTDTDGDGVPDSVDIYPNNAARGDGIWREMFNNVPGGRVSSLTGAASFPNNPDLVEERTLFRSPTHIADNFGSRIHGVFYAPVSGSYTFWISGDDHVQLNLSTDGNPLNKTVIAHMRGWTSVLQWDKYPEQQSQPVNLVAGQPYYLEVLHKEGRYGDHVSVAWQRPGNSTITVLDDSLFIYTP